jgi:hypothetical protein
MGFDHLRHDIDKLANDDDEKIAILAQAIQLLQEESK